MRRYFISLVLIAAAAALAGAQTPDPIAGDLQKDWADQKARMAALADAMPEDKYGFKATEAQRTFGEQLHHLAEAHVRMFKTLDASGKIPAPDVAAAKADRGTGAPGLTKDEIVKALAAAYDYGQAVLAAQGPLSESAGTRSKARVVWAAMNNAMNHYGQCVVYLRLNGIVPPASRR